MPSAPRIIEDPVNVTLMRNKPATLRCAFEGEPKPEVTWYGPEDRAPEDEATPARTGASLTTWPAKRGAATPRSPSPVRISCNNKTRCRLLPLFETVLFVLLLLFKFI